MNFKKLNETGVAHLALLVVVVVVVIGGVGALVAIRQSKLQNANKATTQNTENQQQAVATDLPAQKTEEAPAATTPVQQTQPSIQTPPTPKITHPTDANCPANGGKITVYASVSSGTPVYKQNYADPQLLSHKVAYGSSISVGCYGGGWMEYRAGEQPYYVHYNDVSVTKP